MRKSPTIPRTAEKNCYESGQLARDLGKDKIPSPGLGGQRRAWWLAGWNDRDIELQVAAKKLRDAQRELFPSLIRAWKDVETSQVPYDTRRYQKD